MRLWISGLADKAIREGLDNLRPGECCDNLYLSAKSRSEADWLVGINATQAAALQRVKDTGRLSMKSVERKEASQEPLLLYDLTMLQKEANTTLNFSADKTLSIAQSLYEKKVMSYPRTGSHTQSQSRLQSSPFSCPTKKKQSPL